MRNALFCCARGKGKFHGSIGISMYTNRPVRWSLRAFARIYVGHGEPLSPIEQYETAPFGYRGALCYKIPSVPPLVDFLCNELQLGQTMCNFACK